MYMYVCMYVCMNKKAPALIFRVSNNHFYPIQNKKKVLSIAMATSLIKQTEVCMYACQSGLFKIWIAMYIYMIWIAMYIYRYG